MNVDQAEARVFLDALLTIVNEEAIPYTSRMSPDLLNAQEYNRLGELYKRLDPNAANQSHDSNTASQPLHLQSGDLGSGENPDDSIIFLSETPAKKGPGRPSKRPRTENEPKMSDSWYGVHHLNEIQLHVSLRNIIEENPSHEAAFFLNRCSLTFQPPDEKGLPTTKTLAKLCIPLRGPLPIPVMDNVRWLFEALVIGDLCMFLHGSKDRLTSAMRQSVREAAAELGMVDTASINDLLAIAYNVVFLCSHFGTGSLFWLRPNLTKDFLKNKITKSGQAFEDTQANFRQRDFNQTIEQSGANKLGDAIRAHLQKSYKIGPARDSSNTTTTGYFNN